MLSSNGKKISNYSIIRDYHINIKRLIVTYEMLVQRWQKYQENSCEAVEQNQMIVLLSQTIHSSFFSFGLVCSYFNFSLSKTHHHIYSLIYQKTIPAERIYTPKEHFFQSTQFGSDDALVYSSLLPSGPIGFNPSYVQHIPHFQSLKTYF